MSFYTYIVTNKKHGTLYIGFTNNLFRRITEHKESRGSQFTAKYNLDKLIYFEELESSNDAFLRERQLKTWARQWKIELIEKENPNWIDLSIELFE